MVVGHLKFRFLLGLLGFYVSFYPQLTWAQSSSLMFPERSRLDAGRGTLLVGAVAFEGLRRIDSENLESRITTRVGKRVSPSQVREDILALTRTGFFERVQVFAEPLGDGKEKITFVVQERPAILEIQFSGNSEVKTDELKDTIGLRTFEILDLSKLQTAREKIIKAYEDKGYFLIRVDSRLEELPEQDGLKIIFEINEGEKVRVKQIRFLGNHKLADSVLKERLITQEGGFFSFFSGSGTFRQDAFDRDMQILRLVYFNEGFVDVQIDRPQVNVSPDRTGLFITIKIDEGQQYRVGQVDFRGDLLFSSQEFLEKTSIQKREIFSYEVMQKDLEALQAAYGDLGYAYANVIPNIQKNERERIVNITFEFERGEKVYFGRFTVVGNQRTRDKVVRREMRIIEGELYNETRRRRSLQNIRRLGFFEEVEFRTSADPNDPQIMNVDVVVKERNTGSIQFAAGYGSFSGFTLQGQFRQENFLGLGQKLGASLGLSRDYSSYDFSFTEPNIYDSDWSVGFDLYQRFINQFEYEESRTGAAVRLGYPLGEYTHVYFRYLYNIAKLTAITDSLNNVQTDLELFPLDTVSGDTSSVRTTLEYDTRDDRFTPTGGVLASTSFDYAGLGGSINYGRGSATYRYFYNVFWDVVWRNNLNYGLIFPLRENTEPPFNELYLLGGADSLRGYRSRRVGKSKFSNLTYNTLLAGISNGTFKGTEADARRRANKPFGGRQQLLYQTEFEFPLVKEAKIKGVVFYDVGQAEDDITDYDFYSSFGFGFRWFSLLGPLRFEWGFPLRQLETSPDPSIFEFSIGSPF
jgi:outer membrane protein insertion porin family